jgi:hypothetical protein
MAQPGYNQNCSRVGNLKKSLSAIIACFCSNGTVIAAPALKDAALQVTDPFDWTAQKMLTVTVG